MKKSLLIFALAALVLIAASCKEEPDFEHLDPFGTSENTPTDTTEPVVSDTDDTTDTSVSDTTDTTEPADTDDTTSLDDLRVPFDNEFYKTDKYKVTITVDGKYEFMSGKPYDEGGRTIEYFEDAFIINDRVFLIREGNGVCALYTVNEHGKLQSRMNAAKFTKCGDYIWADGKLYDVDLVEVFRVELPYYLGYGQSYTVADVSYDEENNILHLTADCDGAVLEYSVYLGLATDASIPEGAELIAEEKLTSGLGAALYLADDGSYYSSYDYLTVKLPIEGNFEDVCMIYPEFLRFIESYGGETNLIEVKYLFRKTATYKNFVGIYTVKSSLDAVAEKTQGSWKAEYNGATVIVLEPYTYVIKDGEVIYKTDYFMVDIYTVGDLLVIGDSYYNSPYVLLKPDLTLFTEQKFERLAELGDGNLFVWYEGGGAAVLDTSGETLYEFDKSLGIIDIGVSRVRNADGTETVVGEWALVAVEDGTMRLYTPYGEELCNFGEALTDYYYHWMLTAYYEKEGYPTALYFIFEDKTDKEPETNFTYHSYEYYYSFQTGEYGMIDLGYQEYAYAKPVLYLYPTEQTDVTVTFEHPERLTVDYPKYTDGWRVTAMPDGTLKGENGREYYALYWEEDSESAYYAFPDGFCVSGEDSAAFLEEKLAALGFTDKEANEFIIYWLPILEASEYNLIRFELTEEREASNALHIIPAPDSLLRVAMHVKAVDAPVSIRAQRLPAFERVGFVAVEWGGCIH